MSMPSRNLRCQECGIVLAPPRRVVCSVCAVVRQNRRAREWAAAHPEEHRAANREASRRYRAKNAPLPEKRCTDCGAAFVPLRSASLRCKSCAQKRRARQYRNCVTRSEGAYQPYLSRPLPCGHFHTATSFAFVNARELEFTRRCKTCAWNDRVVFEPDPKGLLDFVKGVAAL